MESYNRIIDFIKEIYPGEGVIPLHAPHFFGKEKDYLNECIDSTFVSSVGPFVDRMERDLATYTGSRFCVAVVNGTSALHIALLLSGVKRGDGVITQAFSFIATSNAISYCGAQPFFVDIDEQTLGMSASALEHFFEGTEQREDGCYHVESGKKITACVPMHSFGMPVDILEIKRLCDHHRVVLIEDAAESIGSYHQGRHTGTLGKFGVFSFNGNKTITCGGGGAIITDDEELARSAKHITTQAKVPHPYEFYHDEIGFNYRCPNINAALLCAQLELIEQILMNKRETAGLYRNFFESEFPAIRFVSEGVDKKSNYWLNAILFQDEAQRENFIQLAIQQKVMVRPAWRPMHHLPMFQNAWRDGLVNTEKVYQTLVNLPSSVRV